MDSAMHEVRLLFVGDSITLGLGSQGTPFPVLLQQALSSELNVVTRSVAESGATITHHLQRLGDHLAFRPDIVVVYIGNIEAIPVPRRDRSLNLVRLLPQRYQRPGWLHPRPYLPSHWL